MKLTTKNLIDRNIDSDSLKTPFLLDEIVTDVRGSLMHWAGRTNTVFNSMARPLVSNLEQPVDDRDRISREVMDAIEASLRIDSHESQGSDGLTPRSTGGEQINATTPPAFKECFEGPYKHISVKYQLLCSRICKYDDQKASIYLQERLKLALPDEYEEIIASIDQNVEELMVHRFGNFLIQCMLKVCDPETLTSFLGHVTGQVAELSRHQFCCHVIQTLLDVSPLVIQARMVAELLDDVVPTMTSPSGTHVWQKLFHLKWSPELPSIARLANNAVHQKPNSKGWMDITVNESGCLTTRSYISITQPDKDRQECIEELFREFHWLIMQPFGAIIVNKLAIMGFTRARALTFIFSKAYEYCKHPVASETIIQILCLKIPSFPARLSASIASYRSDLELDTHGATVLAVLDSVQPNTHTKSD